jgi:hypothetical protein
LSQSFSLFSPHTLKLLYFILSCVDNTTFDHSRSFDEVIQKWNGNGSVNTTVTFSCPDGRNLIEANSSIRLTSKTSVCKADGRWDIIYNNLACEQANGFCNSSLLPLADGYSGVPTVKNDVQEGEPGYTVRHFYENYTDIFVCSETGGWNRYFGGPRGKLYSYTGKAAYQHIAYLNTVSSESKHL